MEWLKKQITKNFNIIKDGTLGFASKQAGNLKNSTANFAKKQKEKTKKNFSRRVLQVHMGDQHVMNIVINPMTSKVDFMPKDGRLVINENEVKFGRSRPTVSIKL